MTTKTKTKSTTISGLCKEILESDTDLKQWGIALYEAILDLDSDEQEAAFLIACTEYMSRHSTQARQSFEQIKVGNTPVPAPSTKTGKQIKGLQQNARDLRLINARKRYIAFINQPYSHPILGRKKLQDFTVEEAWEIDKYQKELIQRDVDKNEAFSAFVHAYPVSHKMVTIKNLPDTVVTQTLESLAE